MLLYVYTFNLVYMFTLNEQTENTEFLKSPISLAHLSCAEKKYSSKSLPKGCSNSVLRARMDLAVTNRGLR